MKKIKTHWYIEIPFSRLGIYYADNLKNRPYCRRNCIVNSNVWWITKDNLPRKTTLLDYSVVQSSPCDRSRHASFAKRKRTEAIDNWIAGVDCFLVFGASRWREDDFTGQICCGCISLISASGFANVKKCMKNPLELLLRWSRKFHA